jgi:hypothetical protein
MRHGSTGPVYIEEQYWTLLIRASLCLPLTQQEIRQQILGGDLDLNESVSLVTG